MARRLRSVDRRFSVRQRLISAASVLLLGIVTACGSSPGATTGPQASATGSARPPVVTPGPVTSGGLCGVFTPDLAVAALGVPVAQPTGGDVVPRPNGIYCHYAAADDSNNNVDAQLKDMTRAEFDEAVEFFNLTEPLPGVGEVAYKLGRSTMGVPGEFVMAWANGRRVTVLINSDGQQAALLAAATAIATKALL